MSLPPRDMMSPSSADSYSKSGEVQLTSHASDVRQARTFVVPSSLRSWSDDVQPNRFKTVVFEQPSQIRVLPRLAFFGCLELKSLCVPPSVECIASHCFSDWDEGAFVTSCCLLESLTFEPRSKLREIEPFGLAGCFLLKTIVSLPRSKK
jgi:hypothetical protein